MDNSVLEDLKKFVKGNPLVILNFNESEWSPIVGSEKGTHEFSFTRPHSTAKKIKLKALCLIQGSMLGGKKETYIGQVKAKSKVATTGSTRINISYANIISLGIRKPFYELRPEGANKKLKKLIETRADLELLSEDLSETLLEELYENESNKNVLSGLAASLLSPTHFSNNAALQTDALHTVCSVFGITGAASAKFVKVFENKKTVLAGVTVVYEDSVIEHDARSVPGYMLEESDITGRAIFKNKGRTLEVYTANRKPLEQAFGVDLIYLNVEKKSIVMLQYKMLEPSIDKLKNRIKDWIYRPDGKLSEQIERMRSVCTSPNGGDAEYRLNPDVFYLKFVKKDAAIKDGGIIMPLNHFEKLKQTPKCYQCIDKKDVFKISFQSLDGSYLRHNSFIELVGCGYVGAYGATTEKLKVVIDEIMKKGNALVAAIETNDSNSPIRKNPE